MIACVIQMANSQCSFAKRIRKMQQNSVKNFLLLLDFLLNIYFSHHVSCVFYDGITFKFMIL